MGEYAYSIFKFLPIPNEIFPSAEIEYRSTKTKFISIRFLILSSRTGENIPPRMEKQRRGQRIGGRLFMRSVKKVTRSGNSCKKAVTCLALGAFMMLSAGFTDGNINTVELTVDGRTFAVNTNAATPRDIFAKAGVTLSEHDEYVYQKDGDKTRLTVFRAVPITIEHDGNVKHIHTGKLTVGEAVEEAGYYTGNYDSSVAYDEKVTENMTIHLTDNAAFIARRQEEAMAMRQEEASRGEPRYSDALYMEATAYLPGDGDGSGITASGIPATYGVAAVDPAVIPLGTRLYIPGYGEAIAADTGGAIVGHKIDLCMESYGEAMQFGRQNVTVYVLD